MQPIKIPLVRFSKTVFENIQRTIGSLPVETGGVLGGNPITGEITEFFFDREAARSPIIYKVAAERINPIIEDWNDRDIHLCGMIHSHPRGLTEPSSHDVEFAHRLLHREDNHDLPRFLIPIVQSGSDGAFGIRVFALSRGLDKQLIEVPFEISQSVDPFPVSGAVYQRTFTRVSGAYDLHRLHNSLVFGVGCGGAVSFYTDLARCGVGRFVLLDPDAVEESNLATSGHSRRDLGRPKVEAVKERILEINPSASVTAIQKGIEDLSDDSFRHFVFERYGEGLRGRLLCGMTDSFWAQMRINLLALNFDVPALCGQVYRGGLAAEIVFMHSETTKACLRCILSGRYDAYLVGGFKNDVRSQDAQYVATAQLNATKLYVALAMLHHGSKHEFWGPKLEQIGQRNFILMRMDPDVQATLGLPQFNGINTAFAADCVWREQKPENQANGYSYNCRDCGGTGNLRDAAGNFNDTAEIVAKEKAFATNTPPSA